MLVGAFFVPTTPALTPEVGRGREREAVRTVAALRRAGRLVRGLAPDALVVITAGDDEAPRVLVPNGPGLRRPFEPLDAPELALTDPLDASLAKAIAGEARQPATDPMSVWPTEALTALFFLSTAASIPTAGVSVPRADPAAAVALGRAIAGASARRRQVVAVAAGELYSRLFPGAAGGFYPDAADFDQAVLRALGARDVEALAALFDPRNEAGADGLAPLTALMATMDEGWASEVLSYEFPFGIGYVVAAATPAVAPPAPVLPTDS